MSVKIDKVYRSCPECGKSDMQLEILHDNSCIYKCYQCGKKTYVPPILPPPPCRPTRDSSRKSYEHERLTFAGWLLRFIEWLRGMTWIHSTVTLTPIYPPERTPPRPDPSITPTTMKGNYPSKDAPLGPPSPGRNPGTGFAPPKRERGTDHTKGIKFWSILIYIIASTMLHSAMLLLSPTLTTLAIIGVLWFWGWVCLHEYWSSEIPKKKHTTEQMATLEELFDGYEDDVPIGRLYFEQDIPNIDPDWNGEYIRWGLTAYTRKPGREDVFLQDLMLSDFEPCDDDEKPKRKKKESSSISGDDDPVAYFEFDKPTIKENPETSFGTVYK